MRGMALPPSSPSQLLNGNSWSAFGSDPYRELPFSASGRNRSRDDPARAPEMTGITMWATPLHFERNPQCPIL